MNNSLSCPNPEGMPLHSESPHHQRQLLHYARLTLNLQVDRFAHTPDFTLIVRPILLDLQPRDRIGQAVEDPNQS